MDQTAEVAPERASFIYMDSLRFVAAAMVVLNHVRNLILVDYGDVVGAGPVAKLLYYLAGFGHQSVMVFFVLSGFWITKSVIGREDDKHFWVGHLIDRISRLGIVLVPVLILGGALDFIGLHWISPDFYRSGSGILSMPDVALTLTIKSFVATLFFLQSLMAPPFGSNGPLWSLAFEFWYYIWFPALWMLSRKRVSLGLGTLALGWFFPPLMLGFLSWLCGSALFFACEAAKRRGWIGRRVVAWTILLTGAAALLAVLVYSRVYPTAGFTDLAISASFANALFGLYLLVPPQPRLLEPIAAYGGRSSFSLYSVHFPFVAFAVALIARGQRCQPSSGSIALVVGMIALAIVVGFAFSRTTEAHTGALRRRLRRLLLPN